MEHYRKEPMNKFKKEQQLLLLKVGRAIMLCSANIHFDIAPIFFCILDAQILFSQKTISFLMLPKFGYLRSVLKSIGI